MDVIGIERTDGHDLFDFRDRDLARRRHHRIEVPRGLAIDEIAFRIALPRLDDGEVRLQSAFENICLAVEILVLLAFGDQRADARLGVEAGNARAAGADALGQRALRIEFQLQLLGEILPLKGFVLADIGRDHLLDLARLQQKAKTEIVHARIVGDDSQALHPAVAQRGDEIFRNAAKAEAAGHHRHVVEYRAVQSGFGAVVDLGFAHDVFRRRAASFAALAREKQAG